MLRRIAAVFRKEVLDNFRDKQTVFYALLFGPILMPLLIAGSMIGSLKQISIDYDEVSELSVIGADRAPNLIKFLARNNIDAVDAPSNYLEALRNGDVDLVLEIMPDYALNFRAGTPAPVTMHVNEADKDSSKAARRIKNLLIHHEQTIANLRMQVRGLNPKVFDVIADNTNDVSKDGTGGQIMASLLPFLLIISMVMGGFYLAIDTTAGERERHSLEPLMSLPIQRWQLVIGKYLATMVFVGVSGFLTALCVYLLFRFFPSDALSSILRFDGYAISKAFLLASPLILLITSLLIAVSAFTRSTKEAQTYLGLLMIIPMAPFFLLQFVKIKSAATIMLLPMMSQYKLLEKVAKNDPVPSLHVFLSVSTTLLAAALLLYLATRLYQQDRILR